MGETPALPSRREEDWRWADLSWAERLADTPAPANDPLPDVAAFRLASNAPLTFLAAGRPVAGANHAPRPDPTAPPHPLADLATAHASAGLDLAVGPGQDAGVHEFLHLGSAGAAHSVNRIVLGPAARLVVVEVLAGTGHDHWLNHRLDVDLGDGAELVRVLVVPNGQGLVSERTFARVGPRARLVALTLVASPAAVRAEVRAQLVGAEADAVADGVLLGHGAGAVDVLTRIEHLVSQARSRQTFRLMAAGRAQVSVAAGVSVARHAQKTDAAQSLKALVLDRTAAANLKPELEIRADDVTCAHGCAVGEPDPWARFYLASRGIPPADADRLLLRAFVADALTHLPAQLAPAVEARLDTWLDLSRPAAP
ncbi:MAG: SufD family Fe-S cluster assembly protein [Sphingomonadaceae bacterium]|nr:SufD family Fe-S cluster assembly protein [Sphingomonadaceae bacterium]MDW8415580.1 SufD family Fe-S cluster assembly protein [Thermaurantiacus sp.]